MSINEVKDKTGKIKEVDLGLAEHEKEALARCREAVRDDVELDNLRDATLARYLRHNSWQVEPSIKQLKEYLAWRKTNKIDQILDEPHFPSHRLIRTIIPYAYHGVDKEGRGIYIEKTGAIATSALSDENILPIDHLMHSHIFGVEFMQRRLHEESLKRGERINGICTILDLEGLGFHHRSCIGVLKTMMDFDQKYYPEYLGKLYVINAPWVAPYLYTAVQVFLDEVTKQRVQLISGSPSEFLLQHIAADQLPQCYGGSCTGAACHHGGVEKDFPNLKGCIDVLDQSQLGARPAVSGLEEQDVAYDFEKQVDAKAEGDVFNWYFEVANQYDIDFSVELLPVNGKREAEPSRRVLVVKPARITTGKGSFTAPYAGAKLIFRWDNNFSYFTSKTIKYAVQCIHPEDALSATVASNSAATPTAASSAAAAASSSSAAK